MLTFDWVPRCIILRGVQEQKIKRRKASSGRVRSISDEYRGRFLRRFKASPINPESIVSGYKPSPRRRHGKRGNRSPFKRRECTMTPNSRSVTSSITCVKNDGTGDREFEEGSSRKRKMIRADSVPTSFSTLNKDGLSLSLSSRLTKPSIANRSSLVARLNEIDTNAPAESNPGIASSLCFHDGGMTSSIAGIECKNEIPM